jgi:putative membrane protein
MHLSKYFATVVATAVGVGLAVVLLRFTDFETLRINAAKVGLAAPVVVAARLGVVTLAGLGWAPLVVSWRRPSLVVFVGLRFIREAVNVLLPVAAVGGDVVGGRLLTRWSVPAAAAAASIMSDLTVQLSAQLLFAALGIGVLLVSGRSGPVVVWASSAVGIGVLAVAGFFAVQRFGFRLAHGGLQWAARRWSTVSLALRLHDDLRAIYARPREVALAVALHLASWFFGVLESFAVLVALGAAPSLVTALVVESLGQVIRASGSPVPGALGIQEGGYMLLVGLYGMPPEAGLALSLTKRIPDLLIGTTGLVAWLGLESGRIGPARARPSAIAGHAKEHVST